MGEACKTRHIATGRSSYSGGVSGTRPDISRKGFERECNPKLEIATGENPVAHAETSNVQIESTPLAAVGSNAGLGSDAGKGE